MNNKVPAIPVTGIEDAPISRRRFLKGLFATGAAVAMVSIVGTEQSYADTAHDDTDLQTTEDFIPDTKTDVLDVQKTEDVPKEESSNGGSYSNSALLGAGNIVATRIAKPVFDTFGVKYGNASLLQEGQTKAETDSAIERFANLPRRTVLRAMLSTVVTIPALEEGIFRAIPSAVANISDIKGTNWALGTATSAAFAGAHGFRTKSGETVVPLPQFSLGMITWWLQRNRGYSHALLAHSVNNLPVGLFIGSSYEAIRNDSVR